MANNNNNKTLNVPNLRFPEFSGEWIETTIEEECTVNPNTEKLASRFMYIDLESVVKGRLEKLQEVDKEEAPSRAQRVLSKNDILFQCVRPYQMNNYIFKVDNAESQWVASTGYAQLRTTKNIPEYIYHLLNTPNFNRKVMVRCTGSSYPAINSEDLSKIHFYKSSSIVEQERIAHLLSLLDKRIATQNKIIDKLQSLIKGIGRSCLTASDEKGRWVTLKDICHITTGKLDANAMVEGGKYPFYTCAEQPFAINEYAFDTEALLISGNGANLGYINYYKGRFNAYQRTYVLDAFTENIQFIKCSLKVFLPQRIAIEKSTSNTPYIVISTLADMRIFLPSENHQKCVVNLMCDLEEKLSQQNAILSNYYHLKNYLLQQMFI